MSTTTVTAVAPLTYRMIVREPAGNVRVMGLPLGCDRALALAWAIGLRDMGNVLAVRLLVSVDGFRSARLVCDV